MTGSGFNVAKYVVEEYVYGKELPLEFAKEEHLWMTVPKAVAFKYIKEEANREKMRRFLRKRRWSIRYLREVILNQDVILLW